ncbi:S26 family signal peptidase [Chamaesiphon sp. OTE_20_metabat_361]|uniref:S26 family signal peptidase n=1 Tax=Chamaesiphon sp. OTE_20_metabat_361 TaxID=2964689 RepID=UPI00286D19F6|nr:S26 family signal peptidase [Chamaesiphon sp. OTE_20_metabat_361]
MKMVVDSIDRSDGSKHAAESEAHRIQISRVIGTPDDRIEIKEGITWVNDKPLPEAYIQEYIE